MVSVYQNLAVKAGLLISYRKSYSLICVLCGKIMREGPYAIFNYCKTMDGIVVVVVVVVIIVDFSVP